MEIKQIIVSIVLLAIALALIIGVIIPLFEHGTAAGQKAVLQGEIVKSRLTEVIR
ncbi:hypothetical protein [Ruminiclostridium cellobioparum]|uniref:hypothetical protein n=1 Tax=Ruminiclostridium cellobioparum TaxID=29355 RepID=UPI000ACC67AE|nr:hypothetical protein [Ruminiclostridium cellobioparum]